MRSSAYRLARQDQIVEDKVIRLDPARSSERLGITGIRWDVFYAHVVVCELVGARPIGVVEVWCRPIFKHWIMDGKASFATGGHFCDRVHASELAGVVDVAIFDHIMGLCQRRDIEGPRFPGAVSHRAIAKSRYQTAITSMPVGPPVRFHP